MKIEEIIKKDFDFAENLVEIENVENLKDDDFIYVVEVNDYDNNKYHTYCNKLFNIILNCINDLQNRNIEEIDNEDNILTNEEIIDLYEKHNNCMLYFLKEKTK